MFDRSERKVLIGLVTGALFSTAVTTVVAVDAEKKSHHLLDSQGKPVMTSREQECVQTPKTPNDPTLRLKECGDIVDSDGDGIPDDEDKCPHNTPEELAGVDKDGDGIDDGVYTEGPRKGCPIDTDEDTVEDFRDECPNSPSEIVKLDGGRGTCINLDPSDSTTPLGCTKDSDGDGVPDCLDDCPNTAHGARVNEKGCAVVEKGETVVLQGDVTFEFNKFDLTPQAMATLDAFASRAVADLSRFADILVEGHTDSIGSDAYNQTLSEKRAAAVKNYLISKGIPLNKIVSSGKGEKEPVADNGTVLGRAQNRRVELRVR
jgi:OOP family OmpA-OmpF porin